MGPENQVIFLCHRPTSPTSDLLVGEQSFFSVYLSSLRQNKRNGKISKPKLESHQILAKVERMGLTKQLKAISHPAHSKDTNIQILIENLRLL